MKSSIAAVLAAASLLSVAAAAGLSPEQVEARVAAWQPVPEERAWERIGWATGLHEALDLAREHRRPVFLFTLDGRMNAGRC